MSQRDIPKQVRATVCDLCDEEIPDDGKPGESGSLTHGWIAHKVEIPKTKRVWLSWPPAGRDRLMDWKEKQAPANKPRRYDFHADCILALVEGAIAGRKSTDSGKAHE